MEFKYSIVFLCAFAMAVKGRQAIEVLEPQAIVGIDDMVNNKLKFKYFVV